MTIPCAQFVDTKMMWSVREPKSKLVDDLFNGFDPNRPRQRYVFEIELFTNRAVQECNLAAKLKHLIFTLPQNAVCEFDFKRMSNNKKAGYEKHFCLLPIAEALKYPNNRIVGLRLRGGIGTATELVHQIAEALQSPGNKVELLELAEFNDGLHLISRALRSEHCQLRTLIINMPRDARMSFSDSYSSDGDVVSGIFESMLLSPSCPLEHVSVERWSWWERSNAYELSKQVMEKPGNRLKTLSVNGAVLAREDVLCLMSGAQAETNVMENLDLSCDNVGSWVLPELIKTLTSPNCRLRMLFLEGTFLTFSDWGMILQALQTASINQMEGLKLGTLLYDDDLTDQPELPTLLVTAAAFLKSQSCRLNLLHLDFGGNSASLTAELAKHLVPAARVSALRRLRIAPFQPRLLSWTLAFHSRWFRILVTLLSLKLVPRLCPHAACRVVPFQDLLPRVAETLGWMIEDLACLTNDINDEDDYYFGLDFDFADGEGLDGEDDEDDDDEQDVPCICRNMGNE